MKLRSQFNFWAMLAGWWRRAGRAPVVGEERVA